ncbi:hypothetical protein PhCBS80983_g05884 [Powellomyces hirtus]|uniref:Sugar phosphate transporter domain-containing protein n=1 Tax=Powellomyces hirtus TaxID=109895 RepID=A0A507DUL8_9FUNG|nr:hypothetical protein PhCBS80983_g05884 [Powellomyces hirtus]
MPAKGYHPAPTNSVDSRNEPQEPRQHVVALSVIFFMVTSIAMLMANKVVLLEVALPVTILWAQILVSIVLMHLGAVCKLFTIPKIDTRICVKLWPLTAINVVGLIFNTYTLHLGDASFYQIARGMVLPLTVLLSWFYFARPSNMVLLSSSIVAIGYALGAFLDSSAAHIPASALMFGAFSSITTAAHVIIIKKAMVHTGGRTMELVYYNNVLSAACFPVIIVLGGEAAKCLEYLREHNPPEKTVGGNTKEDVDVRTFVYGCLLTGILGFLLNVASFLQIKITSPVTHSVSAAARGVLQTFIAVWLFDEIVTSARAGSILVITAGSALYTIVKHNDGAAARQKKLDRVSAISPRDSV